MEKDLILKNYPWLLDNQPKNVIMGDDLDAALSTLLFLQFNPNSKLVGIYTKYNTIYFSNLLNISELKDCIYVDLDIYKADFRSIGHHIVRYSAQDNLIGFQSSCNLNELEGRSVTHKFSQKYPLGTVHFLLWLYEAIIPKTQFAEHLVWLADSSYINGQTHRFRNNMQHWLYELMVSEVLQDGFNKIDTLDFENNMNQLYQTLQNKGWRQGGGSVLSRFHQLKGFQCQPSGLEDAIGIMEYMHNLLSVVAEIMGWSVPHQQLDFEHLNKLTGKRHSLAIQDVINNQTLDEFLNKNKVFSYVFPYKNSINFTNNMKEM